MNRSAMSSGPLSSRIACGCPRQATTCSSTRITRSAGSDVSISMAKPSRTPSSRILKVRNRRPPYKRVAHEIHGPHRIGLRHHDERLAQPNREPLLRPPRQVQPELAIHAPEPLVIPRMPIEPKPIATLPEAPATLRRHQRGERRDHRRIASGPVHEGPIVRGPSQPHRLTGPLNRKAAHP